MSLMEYSIWITVGDASILTKFLIVSGRCFLQVSVMDCSIQTSYQASEGLQNYQSHVWVKLVSMHIKWNS